MTSCCDVTVPSFNVGPNNNFGVQNFNDVNSSICTLDRQFTVGAATQASCACSQDEIATSRSARTILSHNG